MMSTAQLKQLVMLDLCGDADLGLELKELARRALELRAQLEQKGY